MAHRNLAKIANAALLIHQSVITTPVKLIRTDPCRFFVLFVQMLLLVRRHSSLVAVGGSGSSGSLLRMTQIAKAVFAYVFTRTRIWRAHIPSDSDKIIDHKSRLAYS